jgi:site-specific DNA-cytosine methylase
MPGQEDKRHPRQEARLAALGAYVFAGGFTLGVREHFDVSLHLEDEAAYGAATAQRNLGVEVRRLPDWPLEKLGREVWPLIYGNPPCAAWSLAGAKAGQDKASSWRDDPRVACTTQHFGLLEALRPHVWVWESVSQAFTNGREFVDDLAARALALGYSVTVWLHDAKYLGVPHTRKRFMLICHDVELDLPAPEPWDTVTIERALTGINDPGEQHASAAQYQRSYGWLLPSATGTTDLRHTFDLVVKPEDVVRNHLGHVKGRPSFLLRRDSPDRVAATLMHERVHPVEHRFMTLRELQHLCGFPSWWEPNPRDSHELFRGVMPPVGEHLAARVAAALRAGVPVRTPTYRLVDQLRPPGHEEVLTMGSSGRPAAVRPAQAEPATASVGEGAVTVKPRDVRPKPGVGSGAYMRLLLSMGCYDTAEILTMNLRHFPGSRARESDVYWNRRKLTELRAAGSAPVAPKHVPQPTRRGKLPAHVDPDREFDTTSLESSGYGYRVHRDYAAHFFRWGFTRNFISQRTSVLEVGCGVDAPLVKSLVGAYGDCVPSRYVGVDLNRLGDKMPRRPWAKWHGEFNFIERGHELGLFDVIVCLEVIEHMTRAHGDELLTALRGALEPDGVLLLSTPVFNGIAAANHLHEYEIPELRGAIEAAGLRVERRFGTFASLPDVKRVATPEQVATLTALNEYYSTDVTACFLAPLYPDAARNNLWVLRRA